MPETFLPDIPRLYTAVAEWAACLVYILFKKKRLKGVKFVLLAAAALTALVGFQFLAGLLPLPFWVFGMLIAFALMFAFVMIACKGSAVSACCSAAQAFILAEFTAALEWQIYCFFASSLKFSEVLWLQILFAAVLYALVFALVFFLEFRFMKDNLLSAVSGKDLVAVVGVVITAFIVSNISFLKVETPISGTSPLEIFYIRTLVNFCGLLLLYSYREQRQWIFAKNELTSMQSLLDRQYEQYCMSKENIEIIGRKYHDIKHQIAVIRAEENPEKKSAYLDELERGLKTYGAQFKTDNKILDIVLTSKNNFCEEHGINFTVVANGKLLDFIAVMDVCSIFGNALDNAIESVKCLADKEKRLIKLAVFSQGDLLIIRLENYFEGQLQYDGANLLTTKSDTLNHGYGIKSIKSTAKKYDGGVQIQSENNWFVLCVLIPLPKGSNV